jgi:arylsulfatase A-like enzyme
MLSIGPGRIYAGQDKDAATGKGYNIILIAINNVGAEHMSLYGYRRKTTPNIDSWAKNALVFENAYTPVSWTLPVITSVFTALYPYTHKVMDRYLENKLSPEIKLLPQILKDNDYATAAFTGGLDNNKIFGHMRGFEAVSQNPSFTGFSVTLKQSKEWLAKNSKKKFFLFIHGYDAHPPFRPPQKYRGVFSDIKGKNITINPEFTYRGFRNIEGQYLATCIRIQDPLNEKPNNDKNMTFPLVKLSGDDVDYLRDLYDETVVSVDSQVGRFLNSLDQQLLNKTIIIIFSEHGEMFAKHGRFGRVGTIRGTLYDEVVHVPLIIRIPGENGRRIPGLINLIDLMPTILEILRIPEPARIPGRSILPLIKQNTAVNDYIYSGASYNFIGGPNRSFFRYPTLNESIRNENWKLIHEIVFSADTCGSLSENNGLKIHEETFELYNLKDDPDEIKNVIPGYPDKAKELTDKLLKWSANCRGLSPFSASTQKIPDELIKDAQKHGYW